MPAASRGTTLQGSRSAHDVTTPALHASDLEATTPKYHVPTGTATHQTIIWDGTKWALTMGAVTTVTDTYDILVTDTTIICNKTTAFTVTLPVAATGQVFNIKNINTGVVTVVGQGGTDTIDGETSQTIDQWACMVVQCYAANKWGII
jgi:hypothetical protein